MTRRSAAVTLLLFATATPSSATTIIDTYPFWDGAGVTSGWKLTAQTITAPLDSVLVGYRFALDPRPGGGTVGFSVREWGLTGPIGPELYSTTAPWPETGGDIDLTGIDLSLTTGTLYGMVVDLLGYGGYSVHFITFSPYSGGSGFWSDGTTWQSFPSLDHRFRAEFEAAPEPGTSLLLAAGLGLLYRSRRRRI